MTKSRSEIQTILSNAGVKCEWVAMDDHNLLPSPHEVQELLTKSFFEKYRYALNLFDCNSYALVLTAFVTQERYFRGQEYRWAFGMVCGYFPKFSPDYHARCIVICDDEKIYTVEPQTDRMELLDDKDTIGFINYL
jgi:hypothetical protein